MYTWGVCLSEIRLKTKDGHYCKLVGKDGSGWRGAEGDRWCLSVCGREQILKRCVISAKI